MTTTPTTTHTSGAADLPAIISGALFDFAGFLTTLDKSRAVTFSGAHEAGPAVTLLQEWSTKRGLNIDEADVSGWRSALTAQALSAAPAVPTSVKGAMWFTKNPVTIQAIQWTGENLREVITFTDGSPDTRFHHAGMAWDAYRDLVARDGLKVYTLEGTMLASPGDWIIRSVNGEHYPCKDEIFRLTYAAASPTPPAEQQAAPKAAPGEPPGIQALMCVISSLHSLRDTAHFSDEEGELMSALCALRDWAYAQTAAFQPSPKAAPGEPDPADITVPYQKLTNEIDLILSDPDTELSTGAKRALLWMRTWVSVPLYLEAPQPAPAPLSERDAFERDWEKRHAPVPINGRTHDDGRYGDSSIQDAWESWQARAALAAQETHHEQHTEQS